MALSCDKGEKAGKVISWQFICPQSTASPMAWTGNAKVLRETKRTGDWEHGEKDRR